MRHLDALLTVIAILFGVTSVAVWQPVRSAEELLSIHMLDVGQGDAILIEAPGGNQMLIDAGPPGSLLEPLQEVLPLTDRYIDVVLITHPDADHIGGMPELLERYDVGVVITAPVGCEKELCEIVDSLTEQFEIPTRTVQLGSEIDLGNGLVFDVLWPVIESQEGDNDTSIVGVLSYGSTSVMFTGDAGAHVERYLVDTWGSLLDVDILKVGHHGSKTSSAEEFLAHTSPQYALISAAFNSRYGHPHPEVVERLTKQVDEIFETSEWGTVTLMSDGTEWFK